MSKYRKLYIPPKFRGLVYDLEEALKLPTLKGKRPRKPNLEASMYDPNWDEACETYHAEVLRYLQHFTKTELRAAIKAKNQVFKRIEEIYAEREYLSKQING